MSHQHHHTFKDEYLANQLNKINIEPKKSLIVSFLSDVDLRTDLFKYKEISQEMNQKVVDVLKGGDPREKLKGDLRREDLFLFSGHQKAHDLIIDTYFKIVEKRSGKDGLPSLFSLNTSHFGFMGTEEGNKRVSVSFKSFSIFEFDLCCIPAAKQDHWFFVLVDFRLEQIHIVDSKIGWLDHSETLRSVKSFLKFEIEAKKKDLCGVEWNCSIDFYGQQTNNTDCGFFAMKSLDIMSQDQMPRFGQSDLPYLKKLMVYEIVTDDISM